MKPLILLTLICCMLSLTIRCPVSASEKTFVGSDACMECHKTQYSNFQSSAKKASSYESIRVMEPKLTEEEFKSCFECHTTGYGQPGGFISDGLTPKLKNAGCEVCHGPGSLHIKSQDPEDIKSKITIEECNRCHSPERVQAFNFKPLLFGGAH